MTRLSATDVRCAIFASALQQSDLPSADTVAATVSLVLTKLGLTGCLDLMAQEFGDHPEAASERMRWASQLIGVQEIATEVGRDVTS